MQFQLIKHTKYIQFIVISHGQYVYYIHIFTYYMNIYSFIHTLPYKCMLFVSSLSCIFILSIQHIFHFHAGLKEGGRCRPPDAEYSVLWFLFFHSPAERPNPQGRSAGSIVFDFQDSSSLSSASSEPEALLKSSSSCSTVRCFFSSPETSTATWPSYIMMSRLP